MDQRIADFISANRGKYTRDAIRQQLIEAGYSPESIDATWAILDTPDPDEAGVAGEGFWGRFFLFLIGLNVAVFVLVTLATGMLAYVGQGNFALAGVFGVALGIGALLSWGIVAAVGPEKLGRTSAMVIGGLVPILFALLIGGSCYALAGAIPPPAPPAASGALELQIDPPMSFEGVGPAMCQPYSDGVGFMVFSESLRIEGRPVSVSFEFYGEPVVPEGEPTPAPAGPGTSSDVNLYVSIQPRLETDPSLDFFIMPGTQVELDAASDAFSGTVTFDALGSPTTEGPDAGNVVTEDRISGTLTWNCEE